MQAQLFFEGSDSGVAWREAPLPVLSADDDAIVRPLAVARCDFDVPYLRRRLHPLLRLGLKSRMVDVAVLDHFGPEPFAPPFPVGHEFVAEVVEVGPKVKKVRPGDRVTSAFQISCGRCGCCAAQLTSHCESVALTSVFGFGASGGNYGGAICERMRVPFADHMLVPVPPDLGSSTVVAAGDNLCVAWQSVAPELQRRPGARVLVLGGGCQSIALYAVGFACGYEAGEVDYVDAEDDELANERIAKAERLGARQAWRLRAFKAERRYDICVDASSSAEALGQGLRALGPEGVCSHVGILFGSAVQLPMFPMYMRNITLRAGWGQPRRDLEHALQAVASHRFDPRLVHDASVPWEDAASAWMMPGVKVVVERAGQSPAAHRAEAS